MSWRCDGASRVVTSVVLKLRQLDAKRRYKKEEKNFYRHEVSSAPYPIKSSYFPRGPLFGVTRAPLLGAIKANTENARIKSDLAGRIFQQLSQAISSHHFYFEDWAAVRTIVNSCEQSYLSAALHEAPARQLDVFLMKAVKHFGDKKPQSFYTMKRLIDCIDGPLLGSMMEHTKSNCFND